MRALSCCIATYFVIESQLTLQQCTAVDYNFMSRLWTRDACAAWFMLDQFEGMVERAGSERGATVFFVYTKSVHTRIKFCPQQSLVIRCIMCPVHASSLRIQREKTDNINDCEIYDYP